MRAYDPKHSCQYHQPWVLNRIDYITRLFGADWFKDKTLLELGSFESDIGAAFHHLGAKVTCLEARQSNVDRAKQKYPYLNVLQHDLEVFDVNQQFDVILNMGVLYHLRNPLHLMNRCGLLTNRMILETEVLDSDRPDRPDIMFVAEKGRDQAFNGTGCRPSEAWVEFRLEESGFQFQKHITAELNGDGHEYDWINKHNNTYKDGQRRFWTCTK